MTTSPTVIPPELLLAASAVYGVSVPAILSRSRDPTAVLARHAVIWTLRNESLLSSTEIGAMLDRDHTTILAAVASIEAKAVRNARVALSLAALRREAQS